MQQVFAEGITNPAIPASIGTGTAITGAKALSGLISNMIDGMFIVAFILGFIYMVTGGLQWVTSGGDKASLESARNKIIHALIGIIVVASVYAVLSLVGAFLGFDIKKLPIPSIGGTVNNSVGRKPGDTFTRQGSLGTEHCTVGTNLSVDCKL